MDAEVTAIDEKNREVEREESCTECEFMELGRVSKDTLGFPWGYTSDWGIGREIYG